MYRSRNPARKKANQIVMITCIGVFCTGCVDQNANNLLSKQKNSNVSVNTDNLSDIDRLELCRRELEVLKKIDLSVYNKRKAEFNKIISGASAYNNVRKDVPRNTQITVDSLYRYRSDKLCFDISNDVLNILTKK